MTTAGSPARPSRAGFIPEPTADASEAFLLMEMHGAAVLRGDRWDLPRLTAGTRAVLGDRIRALRKPASVAPDPFVGRPTHFDWETRTVLSDPSVEEAIHVDGLTTYGERYPDFVFLLCAVQAPAGGESVVVDGQRLLSEIGEEPAYRDLWEFLWRVPVDHAAGAALPHTCPIVRHTRGGRLTIRRLKGQRLADTDAPNTEHQALLDQWLDLTARVAHASPVFRLEPGDLLCLDNYRILHGRRSFCGARLLHTLAAWSDMAFGVPDLEGIERGATANPG